MNNDKYINIESIFDSVISAAIEPSISFRKLALKAGLDPANDFRSANLRGVDLRDEDLSGFDFSGADMFGADFRRANVVGAIFANANLEATIGIDQALSNPPENFSLDQAHIMALLGREPPDSWRQFIPNMHFGSELASMQQLPGLTWLRRMSIDFNAPARRIEASDLYSLGSIDESGVRVLRSTRGRHTIQLDPPTEIIFTFDPDGRLISLPNGATPIDFAYAISADVGNTCVGAKINGRIKPLMTELANGDEVVIIRSKAQVPPPAWEHIAVTDKARAAIRQAVRETVRKQFGGLGRQILERAFERAQRPLSDRILRRAAARLGHKTLGSLLEAVGRGELGSPKVVKAVHPARGRATTSPKPWESEVWFALDHVRTLVFRLIGPKEPEHWIPIRDIPEDTPVQFTPEGGAVPGDRLVGILTPGEGITVYPIQSPELKEFDDQPERWLDVRWDIEPDDPVRFPARIALTSLNEPGSLAQIASVIAENDGNIDSIRMVRKGADFHEIVVDLEVWDLKHLNRVISELKQKPTIAWINRVNG